MSAPDSVEGSLPPTHAHLPNQDPDPDLDLRSALLHDLQHFTERRFWDPSPPPFRAYSQGNTPDVNPNSYFEDQHASSGLWTPPTLFPGSLEFDPHSAGDVHAPFGYTWPEFSPRYEPPSPGAPPFSPSRISPMPPARSARLPNGYVDLTSEPDPPEPQRPQQKRQSPTPGPSSKRLKRNDGTAADQHTKTPPAKIEEIDLSDGKASVQNILQKQRADAVKAQLKPEEKATTFNNFTCVICMDTPTDITATSCGHLFCHTCLMEALIAGENRSGPGEPKRSQCPVCRKFINRSKPQDIIPLMLKKGLATQPRKNSTATSSKVP